MSSCVASSCICFQTASCASGISASWPTDGVPRSCLFAFSCSAQHCGQSNTRHAPRTPVIFGSAPSALDPWWSSRDSRPPKYSFVLHPWSLPPHETTLSIKKTLRALARSVAVRLVAEQISFSGFNLHRFRVRRKPARLPPSRFTRERATAPYSRHLLREARFR